MLDVIQKLEGVASVPVHLVDKRDDGDVAQAADLEQLACLFLDSLCRVDDHDGGIDGGQGAVGVLAEVRVAWRVQKIEGAAAEFVCHHRGGYGNAALRLHLHPIGLGVARGAARLHGTGHLNGAAEQQELFRQRRLAGIGVGNDGEGATLGDFSRRRGHGFRESRSRLSGVWNGAAPWRRGPAPS